jgi:hypothetical protein
VKLIATDEITRINRWADELVAAFKPKLLSPPEREYEFFIDHLANFIRKHNDDFDIITQVIEAAEQDDPVAHGALERRFHQILDEHRLPPGCLNDYMRRASKEPRRGRFSYEDYGRNIGFLIMVRLICQDCGLQPTRNRASRRRRHPCGCSAISDACKRTRIDALEISESRLANLWGTQGKITELLVDA